MIFRQIVARGLMAGLLLTTVGASSAQEGQPSGKVALASKSVAVGVGVSWGDGTLTYHGKKYSFSVNGLSVIDLGISKVTAQGEVFNLKKVSDFSGNYVAAEAGATAGGGGGAVAMRNQHGVVMKLTSTSQGVQLTLAGKGVDVKLKQ